MSAACDMTSTSPGIRLPASRSTCATTSRSPRPFASSTSMCVYSSSACASLLSGLRTRRWNGPQQGDHVAAARVVLPRLVDAQPQPRVELVDWIPGIDECLGRTEDLQRLLFGLVVLVADLADDLLEQVLERHQAGGA